MSNSDKTHYSYEANISMSKNSFTNENENVTILQMNVLSPMSFNWKSESGKVGSGFVFLDFVDEKVYGPDGEEMEGSVGEALLRILLEKKQNILPDMPEELILEAQKRKASILERGQNARKTQSVYGNPE